MLILWAHSTRMTQEWPQAPGPAEFGGSLATLAQSYWSSRVSAGDQSTRLSPPSSALLRTFFSRNARAGANHANREQIRLLGMLSGFLFRYLGEDLYRASIFSLVEWKCEYSTVRLLVKMHLLNWQRKSEIFKSEIIHDFNCLTKFDKPQQLCLSRIGFVSQSLS